MVDSEEGRRSDLLKGHLGYSSRMLPVCRLGAHRSTYIGGDSYIIKRGINYMRIVGIAPCIHNMLANYITQLVFAGMSILK